MVSGLHMVIACEAEVYISDDLLVIETALWPHSLSIQFWPPFNTDLHNCGVIKL